MPSYMAFPRLRVERLPWPTRLLATFYVISVLAALAVSVWYYALKTELSSRAITEYYQGTPEESRLPGDDEALEAPHSEGLTLHDRKSDLELAQMLHPHSFSVPLMLFVLLHLFGLAVDSDRLKALVYTLAFLAYAALFASPWLARAQGWGACVLAVSGVVLYAVLLAASVMTLYAMWLRPRDQDRNGEAEG